MWSRLWLPRDTEGVQTRQGRLYDGECLSFYVLLRDLLSEVAKRRYLVSKCFVPAEDAVDNGESSV